MTTPAAVAIFESLQLDRLRFHSVRRHLHSSNVDSCQCKNGWGIATEGNTRLIVKGRGNVDAPRVPRQNVLRGGRCFGLIVPDQLPAVVLDKDSFVAQRVDVFEVG
jgi:hypothetical protein